MKLSFKSQFLIRLALVLFSFGATLSNAQSVSSIPLVKGWNLLGNGTNATITVANSLSSTSNVVSVWKWDASTSTWAFYSPAYSDGGASYAAGQKYKLAPITSYA